MEQPQTHNRAKLESNLDHLLQELHQLATRVKQPDPRQQRDDKLVGQAQVLIATGR